MAGENKYVCQLTEASRKVAKEELFEDENERLNAVKAFREWILQQPHITSPTDDIWLLMFLRTAKFSQLRAREILTGYMTCKTEVAPEWYNGTDTADPKIMAFLDSGYYLPLPGYDPQGRKIVIFREGAIETDGKNYKVDDIFRALFALSLHTLHDENVQVNGIVYMSDFSEYSIMHQDLWTIDIIKRAMKCWMKNYPARYKAFNMYNHGVLVEALMLIVMPLMSKKMRSRTKMLGSNMEQLYKLFPKHMLPLEYLPDDYTGPSAGTIKDIIESVKKDLGKPETRERIRYLNQPEWGIDKTKAPLQTEQASFRKLNIND